MYFVARESIDPQKDLERDWSAPLGGGSLCPLAEESEEQAVKAWASAAGMSLDQAYAQAPEFRYHNGLEGIAEFNHEGLGAWELDAENIQDAIQEARKLSDLAVTSERDSGHFYADEVISYHHAHGDIYVFVIK